MKKMMKKIALVMACIMMAGILAGCAKSDASAYLEAVLDNSYKNDSAALVELGIATAEDAATMYEEGLTTEMSSIITAAGFSEDQIEGLREIIADFLAGAKYTVGKAEAQDDGSYIVTVTYKKMNVFGPAFTNFTAEAQALITEWSEDSAAGEEVVSEEELKEEVFGLFGPAFAEAIANATYAEPQTTTVRIEKVEDAYKPNTADLTNLEYLMYDFEILGR